MAGLIFKALLKAMLALAFVSAIALYFPGIFAEKPVADAILVVGFYVYCLLVLWKDEQDKLFHVLCIPVLTQFLHLFQKYNFEAGANAIWRTAPFLILAAYLFHFICHNKLTEPNSSKLPLAFWVSLQLTYILMSPNFEGIAFGGILLIIIVSPLYFSYLKIASLKADFPEMLSASLFFVFIILATGTFGLVWEGSKYVGSTNLLATRNISDTNVTMAYFILLWPFVLFYASRSAWAGLVIFISIFLFAGVIVVSFSRGSAIIVLPYMLISLVIKLNVRVFLMIAMLLVFVAGLFPENLQKWIEKDLSYFWNLRFEALQPGDQILNKLLDVSGRREIRDIAWSLFEQSPLWGHGTGSFEILGPGYREAHSLLYTLLAEQGILGTVFTYSLLGKLFSTLLAPCRYDHGFTIFPLAFVTYFIFNHTVGSVFFIIPARSLTINCIAPILLLCLFFFAKHFAPQPI